MFIFGIEIKSSKSGKNTYHHLKIANAFNSKDSYTYTYVCVYV